MPKKTEETTFNRHNKFRIDFLITYDLDKKLCILSERLNTSKLKLAFDLFEPAVNKLYKEHFQDEPDFG